MLFAQFNWYKREQEQSIRKAFSRYSLVKNLPKVTHYSSTMHSSSLWLLLAVLPLLSANVIIPDCGSGRCSEWMLQYHIIGYNIGSLHPNIYEDDIVAASPLDDVFHDTCKLLAIREVLNNSVQRDCKLLQAVTAQIRESCHYVSLLAAFTYIMLATANLYR